MLHALTSLRFFAAAMIVLLHAKMYFSWPILQALPGMMAHGVSFFFVLSGFILTHTYSAKAWPGYWRFLALRLGRLWPIHAAMLVVLVITVLVPNLIVRHDSVTWDGKGVFSMWTSFAINAAMLHSLSPYVAHSFSWNAPSWSISTELFFYAAFPFLLVNIKRTWAWKLAGSAALAFAISWLTVALPGDGGTYDLTRGSILYANPFVRAFEFCLGMSAWVLWNSKLRHAQDLVALTALETLAVALLLVWFTEPYYWWLRSVPVTDVWVSFAGSSWIFAILIVSVASGRGAFGWVLSWGPLVYLGEISYAVYMIHYVLMKALVNYGLTTIGPAEFAVVLLGLSAAAYRFIEKPARAAVGRWVSPARATYVAPRARQLAPSGRLFTRP